MLDTVWGLATDFPLSPLCLEEIPPSLISGQSGVGCGGGGPDPGSPIQNPPLLQPSLWPDTIHCWGFPVEPRLSASTLPHDFSVPVNQRILTTPAIDGTHDVYCSNAQVPDSTQITNYRNYQG